MFFYDNFLLLLTLSIKLFQYSHGVIVIKPKNSVGLLGEQVIFDCSVNSFLDSVDWFYRTTSSLSIHLTMNNERKNKNFVNKMDIIYNDENRLYISYNLKIMNLTLEDTGSYSCFVTQNFKKQERQGATASLSIFRHDSCISYFKNNHLEHTCNFQITGSTRYFFMWRCEYTANNTIAVKRYQGTNLDKKPMDMFYIITSSRVNYTGYSDLNTCSLNIRPRKVIIGPFKSFDERLPEFESNIHFGSSIANLNSVAKEECIRDKNGFLPLETINQFSFAYKNTHELSVVDHINPSMINNYSCILESVPLGKAIFTTAVHRAFDLYNSITCESKGIFECFENYTSYIDKKTFFIDLQFEEYDLLCNDLEQVQLCTDDYKPCRRDAVMKGIMESYNFLCTTDYKSFYQIPVNPFDFNLCSEHYPQSMANIYNRAGSFYKSVFNKESPNEFLISNFCERLSLAGNLFCVEHILSSSASIEMARWYLKFVSHLKQFRIFSLFPHYAGHLKGGRFVKSCSDFTYRDSSRAECLQIDKCLTPLTLLLETINSGFVVIQDVSFFERGVCRIRSKDMVLCMESILPHCNITIFNLYRSLLPIKQALCKELKRAYTKHHNCYIRIQEAVFITPKCSWKAVYDKLYTHTGSLQEFSEEVCKMGKTHYNCIKKLVSQRCGPEAAYLQRHLVKLLLSHTFDQLFCVGTFNVQWKNTRIDYLLNGSRKIQFSNEIIFYLFFLFFISTF